MGFEISPRESAGVFKHRFVTQEFSVDDDQYSISIIYDVDQIGHAYPWDNPEDIGNGVVVELATLKNGEYFEDTDSEWRVITSDLELGNFLHEWINDLNDCLNS